MDYIYNLLSFEIAHALSWTLLHSIWQGLLIACLLSLLIKHAQSLTSNSKSLISLGALTSLLIISIITFFYYYDFSSTGEQLTVLVQGDLNAVAINLGTEQNKAFENITGYISEYSQYIVVAWVFGFVLFLAHLLFGLFQLNRFKQKLVPLSRYWEDRLTFLADKLNYSGQILLGESKNIQSPITFGLLKPVILFPVGMVNQLSIQEVEAIMAHELAHIVRKDYLVNFLQTLLEGIYYFNPGVWIISSIIRNQREHCCDDMAIGLTGNSVQYLNALVAIEESKRENSLAMGFSSNKKPLLQRVQRILNQPQKNSNMKEKLIMTLIFLIGLMLFTLDLNSKDKNADKAIDVIELNTIIEEEASNITELKTSIALDPSNDVALLIDTIPSETDDIKYLDKEQKYIDVPAFEEKIKSSDIKIIIEDGDIEEMEIDGRDLSEEEISKIQYNLSESELDALKENADIKFYIDEESSLQEEEYRIGIRKEMELRKAEIRREKENIKREIIQNAKEIKKDRERIRNQVIAEKKKIRKEINKAREQARIGIRSAKSYKDLDDLDIDLDDLGDEIAMNISEAFADLDIDLDELQEERIRIVVDFAEDLSEDLEDLEEDLLDMEEDISEEMEDLEEELLDMQEDLLDMEEDILEDLDEWIEEETYNTTEEIIEVIVSELLADNLIEKSDEYSFLLKKNKFQVNGKTLSSSLRAKYEAILEDLTDNEWSSNSKLKVVRKGNRYISEFSLQN